MNAAVGPAVVVLCLTVLALTTWGGWQLYAALTTHHRKAKPVLAAIRSYLTGDRRRAREQQLVDYLTAHPDSRALHVCADLAWGVSTTYTLLDRLERRGWVTGRTTRAGHRLYRAA